MRLRVMDTKQWDLYGPLHTEDVVTEDVGRAVARDKQPKSDGQANRASGREHLDQTRSGACSDPRRTGPRRHHGHTPEIVLTSDTPPRHLGHGGRTVVDQTAMSRNTFHGYGHYTRSTARWRASG
ncbi:hypothetical protein GS434_00010 [Rhodococcus hoagii]|nr:hypothetical protein [Prescottella equi]